MRAFAMLVLAFFPADAGAFDRKPLDRELAAAVEGREGGDPLAGAVIAVKVGDRIVYAGAAGCAEFDDAPEQACRRKLKPESKLRAASISKMATAMAALALEKEGLLDLDKDVSAYLGWTLRNPSFPDAPITSRQLMTHLSSLRDPEEYWVAAPGQFRSLIEKSMPFAEAGSAGSRRPGAYFAYANINYGLLATVLERAAGDRFDRIVSSRVLAPLGMDAGFNWSGVSAKARREGATLYRKAEGRWAAQTDDAAILAGDGPLFLREDGLDAAAYLESYEPGANATLFSPQGGLRASVIDLLALLEARGPIDILWRHDPDTDNGDSGGGLYPAAGLGALAVKGAGALWPDAELVGHSGEAYGLFAGLWRVPADPGRGRGRDVSFAYAITGAARPPVRGAHPAFYGVEEPLIRLAMAAAAEAGVAIDGEPRPFDGSRNAMAEVEAALARAKASGRRALLILGGDWCHDSRSFAMKLEDPAVLALATRAYETVFVDVGRRDRNLDIPKKFGVHALIGTPTILILSPDGALLNRDSISDWRNAASRSAEELRLYLEGFAGAGIRR